MTDCAFCKIASREAETELLYQDEQVSAFRDDRPAAPIHFLIIPNTHITSVNDLTISNEQLVGRLFTAARQLAESEGLAQSGYRLIMNTGPDAGQTVHHIHLHLLGGRRLPAMG